MRITAFDNFTFSLLLLCISISFARSSSDESYTKLHHKHQPLYYSKDQRAIRKGEKWFKAGLYSDRAEAIKAAKDKRTQEQKIYHQRNRDKREALRMKKETAKVKKRQEYLLSRKKNVQQQKQDEKTAPIKNQKNEIEISSSDESAAAKTLLKMRYSSYE